eukprot:scaffold66262_cov62-Phaeocystis_antarctica.AAC.2
MACLVVAVDILAPQREVAVGAPKHVLLLCHHAVRVAAARPVGIRHVKGGEERACHVRPRHIGLQPRRIGLQPVGIRHVKGGKERAIAPRQFQGDLAPVAGQNDHLAHGGAATVALGAAAAGAGVKITRHAAVDLLTGLDGTAAAVAAQP